jgi:hypothetical protein
MVKWEVSGFLRISFEIENRMNNGEAWGVVPTSYKRGFMRDVFDVNRLATL